MIDSDELARRIRYAFAQSARGTKAAVARECDINPQAVTGWERTGSIEKKYIPTLAKLTGRRLEYFMDSSVDDEASAGDEERQTSSAVAAELSPELLMRAHNALLSLGGYDLAVLKDAKEFAAAYGRAARNSALDHFDDLGGDEAKALREHADLAARIAEKSGAREAEPARKVSTREK